MIRIDWSWRIKSDKRPRLQSHGRICVVQVKQLYLTNLNSEEGSTYNIPTGELNKETGVIAVTDYMTKCINQAIEECVPIRTKSAVISNKTQSFWQDQVAIWKTHEEIQRNKKLLAVKSRVRCAGAGTTRFKKPIWPITTTTRNGAQTTGRQWYKITITPM